MPKLTIDGMEIEVDPGTSILQACEQLGIEVPRFCFHDRLSVPANCRMCLVEMERSPKPVASCAMAAGEGMVVKTDSEMVRRARHGVMEFLLINHPLDCPICDQGGECDLQDQAMAYGFDRGRFTEGKRAVTEKNLGPLIQTFMTRCIHCTRCVRFADEIAGVPELGATGRSEHMEIGTYVEKAITSELSGNLVDVCPVGALTSKPYAFAARPWELRKTESIDVMDAVGCNIRVDCRGGEVLRVLPRLHEDINEEWLADKSRYACDGLRRRRLDRPYVRDASGRLKPASWPEAFGAIADRMRGLAGDRMAALAGDMADVEAMTALKDLLEGLGSPHLDCRQDGAKVGAGPRGSYLFNTTIAGTEAADAILLVGTNPRWEAPILNARIRKRWLRGGLTVGIIGPALDLTYPLARIGEEPEALTGILTGRADFAKVLKAAKRPMIIVGSGALVRPDGAAILAACAKVADGFDMIRPATEEDPGWNGFNVLQRAASRVGGLDLGFLPGEGGRATADILAGAKGGDVEFVWLLGADEIDGAEFGEAFVVYQGHHGDRGARRADVILPGAAYTEKAATFVNLEGRAQVTRRAVHPPGDAREDWRILRAFSAVIGRKLPFDDLRGVRRRMAELAPSLAAHDVPAAEPWQAPADPQTELAADPFVLPIDNYYMTDPISRASATMAACTGEILGREAAE